ncbi:MAG: TIGR02710 family CRISPR-associated CARF protein [Thermodesulfobacteriota bacterium]
MADNILLVCTVGGSPEPLIASIRHWRPERLIFFPSRETSGDIEAKILPAARQEDLPLTTGCWDAFPVPDHQDFVACTRMIRDKNEEIDQWLARGEGYQVVFDFTGGTKCMTAALALSARRWSCRFSYVGGTERTKNSVGVVVSGREQVLHCDNPWDVLGYQAVEEAVVLCDNGYHSSAAMMLEKAIKRTTDPGVKREMASLKSLAEACDAWDRFDHDKACDRLDNVRKNINDFMALFGTKAKDALTAWLDRNIILLKQLKEHKGKPALALVHDLLANARRRKGEGRWDDAVARLYRATEALAQVRLREKYDIEDTGRAPLDRIPSPLKERWSAKAREGQVALGLQDDYALLLEWGDELGVCFKELKWNIADEAGVEQPERHSPLVARNRSIWAHGFEPVSPSVFSGLWAGCLKLAGLREEALPAFPRLGRV